MTIFLIITLLAALFALYSIAGSLQALVQHHQKFPAPEADENAATKPSE